MSKPQYSKEVLEGAKTKQSNIFTPQLRADESLAKPEIPTHSLCNSACEGTLLLQLYEIRSPLYPYIHWNGFGLAYPLNLLSKSVVSFS
jgi:hypothetical protein